MGREERSGSSPKRIVHDVHHSNNHINTARFASPSEAQKGHALEVQ